MRTASPRPADGTAPTPDTIPGGSAPATAPAPSELVPAGDEMTAGTRPTAADGRPRPIVGYAGYVARGLAMGSADVVPGVSGGTMAFILGIYERLIGAIRTLARPVFWRPLAGGRFGEAFRAADLGFLLSVLAGILLAVFSLAQVLEWALRDQPVFVWSFFFGLILASIAVVARRIARWSAVLLLAAAAGAAGAYFLVGAVPVQTPDSWWFVFISGVVAICAMILPGISGAFILVLLGKYEFILGAVNDRDVAVLAVFAAGCLIGIVTFAQLLGWLFRRYHDMTVALLIGLMAGSLRKIWPWKAETAGATDAETAANVLPPWAVDGSFNLEILWALLLALAGLVLILALDRIALRRAAPEGGEAGLGAAPRATP